MEKMDKEADKTQTPETSESRDEGAAETKQTEVKEEQKEKRTDEKPEAPAASRKRERKKPAERKPEPAPASREGKRERKKIERLEFTAADLTHKKMFDFPDGWGTALGECPMIDHRLQAAKAEELKILHKLLFKTPGQLNSIKKNIRRFYGYDFERNDAEYDKRMALLVKQVSPDLKKICHVLDLEQKGTKEELCERILDFLLKPEPSGRSPSEKKSKRKSNVGAKTEGGAEEKEDQEKKGSNDGDADATDIKIGGYIDIDEEKKLMAEKNDGPPTKKVKKPTVNAQAKGKKSPAPSTAKPQQRRKKKEEALVSAADISDSESESDDQPLAALKKPQFPTDEELAEKVKAMLEGADLDKITMKIVCRNIYDQYPDQDLTTKKDFIKATVKKIIS